jgi:D-lactate dehydrogenase (cytochrome)
VAYEVDAGLDKGAPEGVVFPHNVEELSAIVRWAHEHGVPLIARGAGTGLSGGAVADRGGVIVEFVHMNRILDIDTQGRSAIVEPALINLRLDEQVKPYDLYFPPDPSSQRASTMGGNVAENSGGPHCFKYGVTTNYITGLDVVLADGRAVRVGGRANDYPAYDLTGLITGSEGTLCMITSIMTRLVRNPPGVKTLLAIFDSVEQAGTAVSAVIAAGLTPATMELIDNQTINIVEPFAHANLPLDAGAVLIIDIDGYPASLEPQIAEIVGILQQYKGYGIRIAQDEDERYKIWLARKSAAGAIARIAPAFYIIDITVPRSRLAEILGEVERISKAYGLVSGHVFHAGDGNLHPNVLIPDPNDAELLARVRQAGREMVSCSVEMGGSLTGEHGVGIEKREYMPIMHNPAEMMAHWNIKQVFDPQCIFNPGKIFPAPTASDGVAPFAGHTGEYLGVSADGARALQGEIFTPQDAEEAAAGMRALAQAGRSVSVDRPVKRDNVTRVSTEALRGIKTYAPEDLYITAGAGTPLSKLQAFLAQDGKQLAIASPWERATIGGIVGANNNAPLRMRYGSIRDLTLYATVALADGRVIRTGRPIVKNVAGYDLTKLIVGSHGTLGLMTDVTFKIHPLPRHKTTLLVPVEKLDDGLKWAGAALPLALNASGIVLSKGYQAQDVPQSNYLLAYTAEGLAEDVLAELAQVRQALTAVGAPEALEVSTTSATDIWASVLGHAAGSMLKVRAGVPVKDLPDYLLKQERQLNEGIFCADIGSGFVYAVKRSGDADEAQAWLAALRQPTLDLDGYTVVIGMPDPLFAKIDRWGYQPQALDIMQRLKQQWDPRGTMNPGEFVVG